MKLTRTNTTLSSLARQAKATLEKSLDVPVMNSQLLRDSFQNGLLCSPLNRFPECFLRTR